MPDKLDKPRRMPGNSPATTRRRRYAPTLSPNLIVSLTPVKVQMLSFLAELRFLSLPQLARLCCPAERRDLSDKSARRHLRALFDAGLVDVLPVSRAALAPPDARNDASLLHGSAPNVYALTKQGMRLLCRAGHTGEDLAGHVLPTYGPKNALFLAHELLVRDVRVWLEECARNNRDHAVERWEDGEAAAIPLGGSVTPRFVRPDAWFAYRMGRIVLVGLVEADRGTERGDRRWREKLDAYGALYASGSLQAATGYVNARVLVVCPDGRRRERLADLISAEGGTPAGRFWLAERAALDGTGLGAPLWLRPGGPTLHPLVG